MPPETHLIVDEATPALTEICASNKAAPSAQSTRTVVQAAISYRNTYTFQFMMCESRGVHAYGPCTE